jgi:peptide/nickel transport system permease protein
VREDASSQTIADPSGASISAPKAVKGSLPKRRSSFANRTTLVGLCGLVLIAATAVFAPLLAPHDPLALDLLARVQPPSWSHPFGTDELGRDNLARVLYGGRLAVVTALVATAVASSVGVSVGMISGYFGGVTDVVLSRAMDFLLAIPAILLAVVIIAVLGPSQASALAAVAIVSVPQFARLARASALSLREREFVLASIGLGAGIPRIILRTILPNSLGPIIVQCAITGATAIGLEAALSFLGLGAQPPAPSWGLMLSSAEPYLQQAPWYALFPGLALTLTVLSLDAVARGLSRALTDRSL